jgi:hypothetical protein
VTFDIPAAWRKVSQDGTNLPEGAKSAEDFSGPEDFAPFQPENFTGPENSTR